MNLRSFLKLTEGSEGSPFFSIVGTICFVAGRVEVSSSNPAGFVSGERVRTLGLSSPGDD